MNKNQNGFSLPYLILFFLTLAGVTLSGWYVWKNSDRHEEPAKQTSEAAKSEQPAIPETEKDPYQGWKSFDSEYGYSFKYPGTWELRDISNTVADISKSLDPEIISLHTNRMGEEDFNLVFSVSTPRQSPNIYPVDSNVQKLANNLRIWAIDMTWSSKMYNNYQRFKCPRLRLLAETTNTNIPLAGQKQLSSEAGFCHHERSYTTKSKEEQLNSDELRSAIKVYESIKLE